MGSFSRGFYDQKAVRLFFINIIMVCFVIVSFWGCVKYSGTPLPNTESAPTLYEGQPLDSMDADLKKVAGAILLLKAYVPGPCRDEGAIGTCTAVAIGQRLVLTAAHCVAQSHTIAVYRGIETLQSGEKFQPYFVQKKEFLNPQYPGLSHHQGEDLAKLTLDRDLDPDQVAPVKLADPKDRYINTILNNPDAPQMSLEYVVLGRGLQGGQKNDQGKLSWARLKLVNSHLKGSQEKPVIAMKSATDPGDSGAPLLTRVMLDQRIQWVLLGILSGTRHVSQPAQNLSVFVPIPLYLDFIEAKAPWVREVDKR